MLKPEVTILLLQLLHLLQFLLQQLDKYVISYTSILNKHRRRNMSDIASSSAKPDSILNPSEIIYMLSLGPKFDQNSVENRHAQSQKRTQEASSTNAASTTETNMDMAQANKIAEIQVISPDNLWQGKYNFYKRMYEYLRDSDSKGLLNMPLGEPNTAEGLSVKEKAEEILAFFTSRNDSTKSDQLDFEELLGNYQSDQNSDEYKKAASKLKAIAIAALTFYELFKELDTERKGFRAFGNTRSLSTYRCVLTGNILKEPVKLHMSNRIYCCRDQLRNWSLICRRSLNRHFNQTSYQSAGIEKFIFDPATGAPNIVDYVENEPILTIDNDHKSKVDGVKKALIIQRVAHDAVSRGDVNRFLLLMSVPEYQVRAQDQTQSNIDRAWRIHTSGFQHSHYSSPYYVKFMKSQDGNVPHKACVTQMTEAAKKLKETLEKKKKDMDTDHVKTPSQPGMPKKAASGSSGLGNVPEETMEQDDIFDDEDRELSEDEDRELSEDEDRELSEDEDRELSEVAFVVKHGKPDISLDLFATALCMLFDKKNAAGTEGQKTAKKLLEIAREQLSNQSSRGHAVRTMYMPNQMSRKELLVKDKFKWKEEVSPVAAINVLLNDLNQLYASTLIRLGDTNEWSRASKKLYFWFNRGCIAQVKRTIKITEKPNASSWKKHVTDMLTSPLMKKIVVSRYRGGKAMREILERLELAVKAMTPGNNNEKRQKQISDKKRAVEMLEELPTKLGFYFEKTNNNHYISEVSAMQILKNDLDALLVSGEMLLTQLSILNLRNTSIHFGNQSKKESKEAQKETNKKLEAYEKDKGHDKDTLKQVVKQAESSQDGMSKQDKVLMINDQQLQEKDKVISEKDQKLEEKDQKLEEKDQKLEEKDQKLEEKDQKLQEKDAIIAKNNEESTKAKEELIQSKEEVAALQAQLAALKAANTKSSQQTGSLLTGSNRVNQFAQASRDKGSDKTGLTANDIDEDAVCIDASVNNAI